MATQRTVKIVNSSDLNKERLSAGVITPGDLVELNSSNQWQRHATADGDAVPIFAVEDEYQGNGIDDDYAASDPVTGWFPARGDEVHARLADGETVVIGDLLSSNGDGKLKKWEGDGPGSASANLSLSVVAVAMEALDLSASSGAESSAITGDTKLRVFAV